MNENRKPVAEALAHVLTASIAMQKFHPDPDANLGGEIISTGIGVFLVKLLGHDDALDLLEDAYAILNAGPFKGTGLIMSTQRKLTKDSHDTSEAILRGLRERGML